LIIYDETSVSVDDAIDMRIAIASVISVETGIPADALLLTPDEVAQTMFFDRVSTVRLT